MAAHRGVRLGLCMLRRSWGGQHHSVNFLSSTAKAQARRAQTVPKRVDEVKAAPRARLAKISLAKSWDEVLDITALTPELIGYVVNERGDTFDLMTSDEYYEQLKASVESMRLKGDPFARQDMSSKYLSRTSATSNLALRREPGNMRPQIGQCEANAEQRTPGTGRSARLGLSGHGSVSRPPLRTFHGSVACSCQCEVRAVCFNSGLVHGTK